MGTTPKLEELGGKFSVSADLGAIIEQPNAVIHSSPSNKIIDNVRAADIAANTTTYRVLFKYFTS